VSQGLQQMLIHDPPATWELDHHAFEVVETICDAARHPWSGTSSYETLAAAQLLRGDALPRQVTLDFASPTAFKSKEMHIPVPMPALVFGSLVERWNSFSPVTVSPELRRFGDERVAISRYKLESRPVPSKPGAGKGGLRMGGVGRVTYTALGGDRYWLGLLHMLAAFALYSGVGVQTSVGMGQVRVVDGKPVAQPAGPTEEE
jgi:CRISPR-associated endoribonuclease Cas6